MADRLSILRRAPRSIIDWGAALGGSEAALRGACPGARRIAVRDRMLPEATVAMEAAGGVAAQPTATAGATGRWVRRWFGGGGATDDAPQRAESDLPDGQADLLWSNMALHHHDEPQAVFARWQRWLAVDGILMFSTLGPGSLETLRRLYRREGWSSPHAPFVDMHDLGDMLVQAGFADPVMDQELLTLTWATPDEALAELRLLGGNADASRHAGLRTPRWRARLLHELARAAAPQPAGRIALEFEVVYGHAVRTAPRLALAAETTVPLADLRGMLRSRRGRPGALGGGGQPDPLS
jgi:malonyl-CoA O-methyltransferase